MPVMFDLPGFTALLLLETGEPTGFGITIEFLMSASAASVVAGLYRRGLERRHV